MGEKEEEKERLLWESERREERKSILGCEKGENLKPERERERE